MKRPTRSSSQDWLVGPGNDQSLAVGSKLPINSLVLRRYVYLKYE